MCCATVTAGPTMYSSDTMKRRFLSKLCYWTCKCVAKHPLPRTSPTFSTPAKKAMTFGSYILPGNTIVEDERSNMAIVTHQGQTDDVIPCSHPRRERLRHNSSAPLRRKTRCSASAKTMATDEVVFHPSEITEKSVAAALMNDKGSDARLVSFTVQECTKKGDNYATFVARVNVNFSSGKVNNATSYIVKYNPKRFKLLEEFSYISFQKEQVFYQQLIHLIQTQLQEIGQTPLRVPHCFYISLEENREVIFLEDLQPRGFRMFDRKKGMDVAHTKLVLEELARLHAASYLLKAKIPDLAEKYPILSLDYFNYGDDAAQLMQGIFSNQIDIVKGMLNKIGGYEVAENWLARNKARGSELMKNHLQRVPPFDVLCHGDCWVNNVLFRYEDNVPVEVMLLDLQLCRQASLATDLSFLLHTSLEGHVRKTKLETFLDIYYSTFLGVTEAGKTAMPFSRQELRQEYKNRLEYGLLMSLVVNVLILCDGEINEDDPEGYLDSMKDILNEVSKSSLLHSRFLSVFDEMIENNVIV